MRSRAEAYPELIAVVLASIVGLTVQSPLRWLVDHRGIDVLLVVLVFATAVTITVGDLGRVAGVRVRLAIGLLAGTTVLPALAWISARLVVAGPLRDGMLTIGVAPCEIASVAAVAIAGGQPAVAAVLLIGSTVLSVALAGPILVLERGGASISVGGLVVNLLVVVVVPLVVGIVARARIGLGRGKDRLTGLVSTAAVAALVALIASRVELSREYLAVVAAMVLFTAGGAGLGRVLSVGADGSVATAMLLTTSMRDFAIAAGIAASAFGARAAAPLGLYGIVVLVWGTAAAGILRQRTGRTQVPL
jgi:predicted Na+-dependent transporter